VVAVGGIVLWFFGRRRDLALSLASYPTMLLGAGLTAVGVKLAGSLAAILLGSLVLAGGIGIFLMGMRNDDPAYVLLPLGGSGVVLMGCLLLGVGIGHYRKQRE